MVIKKLLSVAGIVGSLYAGSATAVPVLGQTIMVSTTGDVTATFVGSAATFNSQLFLVGGGGTIFDNFSTPPGTTVSLGSYAAGTVLTFGLAVLTTGETFYTGPGALNPDGVPHAIVDDMYAANTMYVGFEDLFGGGDQDYNDLEFLFTNVHGVPEPMSLALLGAGLAGVAVARKRRTKSAAV